MEDIESQVYFYFHIKSFNFAAVYRSKNKCPVAVLNHSMKSLHWLILYKASVKVARIVLKNL